METINIRHLFYPLFYQQLCYLGKFVQKQKVLQTVINQKINEWHLYNSEGNKVFIQKQCVTLTNDKATVKGLECVD